MRAAVFALGMTLAGCGAVTPAPTPAPVRNANATDGYVEAIAAVREVAYHVAQLAPRVQNDGFFHYSEPVSELEVGQFFDFIARVAPVEVGRSEPFVEPRGTRLNRTQHIAAMHEAVARALVAVRDHTPGASAWPPSDKTGVLNALTWMEMETIAREDRKVPDYVAADAELRKAFGLVSDAIAAHELPDDSARLELRAALQENARNGGESDVDSFGALEKPPPRAAAVAAAHLRAVIAILLKRESDPAMARAKDETLAHVRAALRIVER